MLDAPDYARRWDELKNWVEYEAEAAREDARGTSDDSDYGRSNGGADALSRVLPRMVQLES